MDLIFHLYPNLEPGKLPSFEQLMERIRPFDGMFVEQDGSFVWIDRRSSPPRQMDGMIYDRQGRLEYIEIKGRFSLWQWHLLCAAISGSQCNTMNFPSGIATDYDANRLLRIHCPFRRMWFTMTEVQAMIEQ